MKSRWLLSTIVAAFGFVMMSPLAITPVVAQEVGCRVGPSFVQGPGPAYNVYPPWTHAHVSVTVGFVPSVPPMKVVYEFYDTRPLQTSGFFEQARVTMLACQDFWQFANHVVNHAGTKPSLYPEHYSPWREADVDRTVCNFVPEHDPTADFVAAVNFEKELVTFLVHPPLDLPPSSLKGVGFGFGLRFEYYSGCDTDHEKAYLMSEWWRQPMMLHYAPNRRLVAPEEFMAALTATPTPTATEPPEPQYRLYLPTITVSRRER